MTCTGAAVAESAEPRVARADIQLCAGGYSAHPPSGIGIPAGIGMPGAAGGAYGGGIIPPIPGTIPGTAGGAGSCEKDGGCGTSKFGPAVAGHPMTSRRLCSGSRVEAAWKSAPASAR